MWFGKECDLVKWMKDDSLLCDKINISSNSFLGLDRFSDISKIRAISMMQFRPTFNFANVMKSTRTSLIIPFPIFIVGRWPNFSTFLRDTVRLSFIPVSVRSLCSINPEPAWFGLGIPMQSNPCPRCYFGGKCLLFSLCLYHSKSRSQCFTGGFCCIPAHGFGWDLVTRAMYVDPIVWTNSYKIFNVR